MKKYLIAAAAALGAFAFFASAAGLLVRAPVLQVGQTDVPECTERADVVAWGYNDHLADAPISAVTIQLDADHTCDGETMYVTIIRENGSTFPAKLVQLTQAQSEYRVIIGPPEGPGAVVPAADVAGVRIGIDQGLTNWTF